MVDYLTLAISSDWHLGNHAYGFIDDTGRPSSLLQYIQLAKDFSKFGYDNDVDAMIIAGDLVDQPVLKPMVSDVLEEVINILSEKLLIITHGQHDLDTKTEDLASYHSVLSRFKSKKNVVYADKFDSVCCLGFSMAIAPWNSDHAVPEEEADIFIGHGAVRGCTNYDGYRFNAGFDQQELFKKFKLSIVGDIHNGQVFNGVSSRKILIPGSPVQYNYKDSPTCGFWIARIPKDAPPSLEFTSIEKIHPDFYHKFLFTDDPDKKSSSLTHYRYRPPKDTAPRKTLQFNKDVSSIRDIGASLIAEAKIPAKELVSSIFSKLIESLPSSDRKVPRSRLHNLEIHNFLSIEDFTLDFKEFPDSLVITGKNGSGKSSLVEAIFWCLTGTTTKGVAVNDVKNWYGETGVWVSVILEVEDTMYKIGRGRTDSGPQLQIFMFTDKWSPYTGTKTSCTQDVIYELLGIDDREIKLLSYFPAKSPNLFGSIGKSDRLSLLSTIVGMSTIDAARDKIEELVKDSDKTIYSLKAKIDTLRSVKQTTQSALDVYLREQDSQVPYDTQQLEEEKAKIEASLKVLIPGSEIKQQLGCCYSKRESIVKEISDLKTSIIAVRMTLKDIEVKKVNLRTALDGKCHTCGQSLHDETLVNALFAEIEDLKLQASPQMERDLVKQYVIIEAREKANEEDIAKLKSRLSMIQDYEARLSTINSTLVAELDRRVDYTPMIKTFTDQYEEYSRELTHEEVKLDELVRLQDAQNWINKTLLKRNGLLISALSKQGKKLLQDQVDALTNGEDFYVAIEDDLSVSATFLDRQKADYNQLSTGQARVVDIIMMVALGNLFTRLYALEHGVLGLVIFDEVLSFLDPVYAGFCFALINNANVPKKIVITHDRELVSKFNNEISVTLEGESSSVYTKNW